MKRYKIRGPIGEITRLDLCFMELKADGEWVKWEDAKDAITAYEDWIERGLWPIDKGALCNCGEKVMETTLALGNSSDREHRIEWICPAHGYKKR